MADLSELRNFKGVTTLYQGGDFALYRAVDCASGAARWVYRCESACHANDDCDPHERNKLRQFQHNQALTLVDWGVGNAQKPYWVVECVGGHCLTELIGTGRPSEIALLSVMLQLVRVLSYASQCGLQHYQLQPQFVFLTTDKGLEHDQSQPQVHLTGLGEFAARHFSQDRQDLAGEENNFIRSAGQLVSLMLQWWHGEMFRPALVQRKLSQAQMSAPAMALMQWCVEGCQQDELANWSMLERRLLVVLSGRHLLGCQSPEVEALRSAAEMVQSSWQLLDCYRVGPAGWWRSVMVQRGSDIWQQGWLAPCSPAEARGVREAVSAEDAKECTSLLMVNDVWLLEGRNQISLQHLLDYQPMEPLALLPFVDGRIAPGKFMRALCEKAKAWRSVLTDFTYVDREQVFISGSGEPVLLPIAPTNWLGASEWKRFCRVDEQSHGDASLVKSLAVIGTAVYCRQYPRVLKNELQLGTQFQHIPEAIGKFLRQCLVKSSPNLPSLDDMIKAFAVADNPALTPEPQADLSRAKRSSAKTSRPAKKDPQSERKKLLLLLLLILLFQTLVNVGIIAIFN